MGKKKSEQKRRAASSLLEDLEFRSEILEGMATGKEVLTGSTETNPHAETAMVSDTSDVTSEEEQDTLSSVAESSEFIGEIEDFLASIEASLRGQRPKFEHILLSLNGYSFGTLEANQRVASLIQMIANLMRVAFRCPRCGQPARLKCAPNTSVKDGTFAFVHTGSTHGGTATFPDLQLTDPPEDRRRRDSAES